MTTADPQRQLVVREQIVKVLRGTPLPEGWEFARLIYTTTDLFGTWDVMLVQATRGTEAS